MKKLLLALLVGASTQASAQHFRVAPEIGVNFSNMTFRYEDRFGRDYKESGELKAGLKAGLILDGQVSRNIWFQPGLFYVMKGYRSNIGPNEASVKANYLELPLNFLYKTGGRGAGRFFIGGGPYVAAAIGGKIEDRAGRDYDLDFGDNINDDLRRLDAGLNITTGYEFPRGVFIRTNAGFGLVNIAPDNANDTRIRNWGLGVSLGYFLQ
jgi:hypothetical protein